MKIKYFGWTVALAFVLLQVSTPRTAMATDLIVEQNPSDPSHFSTIQSAINYANNLLSGPSPTATTFRIRVKPGTYSGPIAPISNVPIIGFETARTIIVGSSTGALIAISNVTNIKIENLTITNAATGITVSTSSSIHITNNIFQVGASSLAVQVQNSPTTEIINNTFYLNGTAISTNSDILITNNIFSNNGTAISAQVSMTQITYNDYYNNTTIGVNPDAHSLPNFSVGNANPLFVNPASRDFHLLEGSPCHSYSGTAAGNPSYPNAFDNTTFDMGVYGGGDTDADTIPFIISGVTFISPTADSVKVSWSPNNSYNVTNSNSALQGGYNIYYNFIKSGPPYLTKVTVPSTDTSTLISGLTTTVSQPSAPVLNEPGFANETLLLSWSLVPTATSYFVHYTDLVTTATNTIDVGNATAYTLTGLINGHNYTVTVSAVAQPEYHFSVTAFDYSVVSSSGGTPGVAHESAYLTPDLSLLVGTPSEGPLSNSVTAFPEAIVPNPDLPNKGCFIATAAYGYYSAPQVQALRAFRDKYLMASAPGRAFVEWYYRYGPIGAEFINTHAWLKPVVRIALLPAVGGALFMTRTSLLTKLAVLILAGILAGFLMQRRKHVHSGGAR